MTKRFLRFPKLAAASAAAALALAALTGWPLPGARAETGRPPDPDAVAAAQKSAATAPAIVWEHTYGGSRIDAARRIVPWGKDGFAVAGRTRSKGQGGDDVWLIFIDGQGTLLQDRVFGTPDFDWVTSMIGTGDGGLALVGSRSDKHLTHSTGWVIRLDDKVRQVWRRDFDGGSHDGITGLTAIDQFADGGFVVVGATTVSGAGQYDGWILRLDKDGHPLWDKKIGSQEEDALFGVAALPDGGIVASGTFGADGNGWVLRLDAKGRVLWEKRVGGAGYDVFNAVALPRNGGVVVTGTTRSEGPGGGAAWVMRLDDAGKPVWERLLAPVKGASANSAIALADGGLLVLGGSVIEPGLGTVREQAWVARLDAAGKVLWTRVLGGAGDDNLFSGIALSDGGFVVAGFTNSKGAGEGDVWVVRLGYK